MVTEDVLRKKFEHLRVAGGPILVEFYLVELCAQWYVFARNGHTQIEGTSYYAPLSGGSKGGRGYR